jgi:hypothetical protein
VTDPRGWEALTQQEAEQDARKRTSDVSAAEDYLRRYAQEHCWPRLAECADVLALAVRERDQARDALRRIAEGSTVIDYDTPALAREIARAALGEGKA